MGGLRGLLGVGHLHVGIKVCYGGTGGYLGCRIEARSCRQGEGSWFVYVQHSLHWVGQFGGASSGEEWWVVVVGCSSMVCFVVTFKGGCLFAHGFSVFGLQVFLWDHISGGYDSASMVASMAYIVWVVCRPFLV